MGFFCDDDVSLGEVTTVTWDDDWPTLKRASGSCRSI